MTIESHDLLPLCYPAAHQTALGREASSGAFPRHGAAKKIGIEWTKPDGEMTGRPGHAGPQSRQARSRTMRKRSDAIRNAMLAGVSALVMGWALPALSADVTADRLANPDKEPQNWLMNHRSYDAQRFSPLARINKDNVKNLKLAYAVAIGGTSVNENLQSTPLVEDGFMYVVDQWGVLYKIDVRSGDVGRIVWRMDPGQEKVPLSNRGAALWGNLVVTVASYPARVIATHKDNGK